MKRNKYPMLELRVLYEDNHLLVIDKPAGIPTMGVAAGQASMVALAQRWIKQHYQKPGNVFVGVVSRLDRLVSGVLVLARTSKAARRLTEQFRGRTPEKVYWACVERSMQVGHCGMLVDFLKKDEANQRMKTVGPSDPGGQIARLEFRVLLSDARQSLLEVRLLTGRKHQIRLQLAQAAMPVIGDHKYGARHTIADGIALHSRKLTIEHPTIRKAMTFEAAIPKAWKALNVMNKADQLP